MAVGGAVVVVLSVAVVVLTRPSEGPADVRAGPSASAAVEALSLAGCQAALVAKADPNSQVSCGYKPFVRDSVTEPAADPHDPRYAGAALPTGLSTAGIACVTGSERPVLDTVAPALSAYFTAVPGLERIESTFQLRSIDGPALPGDSLAGNRSEGNWQATLDLRAMGPLKHGTTYRWRVRATPPSVAAGGWSQWCEFTVGAKTSDDMGLDQTRKYTVGLPAGTWREVLKVLGPVQDYGNGAKSAHAPIENAVKAVSAAAQPVSVTLTGQAWSDVVNGLASRASLDRSAADWKLADLLSAALDGPPRPTMGFARE